VIAIHQFENVLVVLMLWSLHQHRDDIILDRIQGIVHSSNLALWLASQ